MQCAYTRMYEHDTNNIYCIRTIYIQYTNIIRKETLTYDKTRKRTSSWLFGRHPRAIHIYMHCCRWSQMHTTRYPRAIDFYICCRTLKRDVFAATHCSAMHICIHTRGQYISTLIAAEIQIYVHSRSLSINHCRSLPCNTLRHPATLCNTLQQPYLHSLPQTDTGAHEKVPLGNTTLHSLQHTWEQFTSIPANNTYLFCRATDGNPYSHFHARAIHLYIRCRRRTQMHTRK